MWNHTAISKNATGKKQVMAVVEILKMCGLVSKVNVAILFDAKVFKIGLVFGTCTNIE